MRHPSPTHPGSQMSPHPMHGQMMSQTGQVQLEFRSINKRSESNTAAPFGQSEAAQHPYGWPRPTYGRPIVSIAVTYNPTADADSLWLTQLIEQYILHIFLLISIRNVVNIKKMKCNLKHQVY